MIDLVEARLAAQRDLSGALASARELRAAAPKILDAIGKHLGCVLGEMWITSDTRPALQSVATWSLSEAYAPFLATDTRFEFERGRGLPGLAWESACPQWMTNVSTDASFERRLDAIGCGLGAAVAFPIVFDGVVLGVVQFFYAEEQEPNERMMTMFADVGAQIGLFIERARASATAIEQAKEILELSSPILRVAPDALLLPIIGSFDAQRAVHVTERLLSQVVAAGARAVVLDLTSAGTMDTFMAQRLLDTVAAVKLLGARTILTGLQPQAARALALIGFDAKGLEVCSSLADGLDRVRYPRPS